jgi:hypothetical protein
MANYFSSRHTNTVCDHDGHCGYNNTGFVGALEVKKRAAVTWGPWAGSLVTPLYGQEC